jgi:tight adherence protein C
MNSTQFIIMATAFIGVASLAWWVLQFFNEEGSGYDQRLKFLKEDIRNRTGRSATKKTRGEQLLQLLENKSDELSKPLQPKTEKDINKLRQRLTEAGYRKDNAVAMFLSIRVLATVVIFLLGGGITLIITGFSESALMPLIVSAGIGLMLPNFVLDYLASARKLQIFRGLPDALDLMVVCVESGLGLDQAMRKVAEEMKKSYKVIAEEFGLCNLHLQMGRTRSQVLQELGSRTGVDDLRALGSTLIQADKFGTSIAQALRIQSDAMRTKRQQIAEEKAAKTAVKLIFPLVLFIFPGIFVVLVGPAGIQMARDMLPLMGAP